MITLWKVRIFCHFDWNISRDFSFHSVGEIQIESMREKQRERRGKEKRRMKQRQKFGKREIENEIYKLEEVERGK